LKYGEQSNDTSIYQNKKKEFEITGRPRHEFDAFIEEKRRSENKDVKTVFEPEFAKDQVQFCYHIINNMTPLIDSDAMLSIAVANQYNKPDVYLTGSKRVVNVTACYSQFTLGKWAVWKGFTNLQGVVPTLVGNIWIVPQDWLDSHR
jgi:hypothetical protein